MKKIISCLLVLFLVSSILNIPVYATSNNEDYLSKIDDELLQKLKNDEEGNFNVSVWFNDISENNVNNEINKEVETFIDKNTSTLAFRDATIAETLQNDNFNRSIRNKVYKKLYSKNNSDMVGRFKSNISLEDENVLFSSSYTPNVTMKLNASEIYTLAQDVSVDCIYLATTPNKNVFSSSSSSTTVDVETAFDAIGISSVRDDFSLTGSSIKIGLIDSTKVNRSLSVLANLGNKLVIDPLSNNNLYAHASKIAAIMVGKKETNGVIDYLGAVPDATLYSTTTTDNNSNDDDTDEWKERMEGLVDSGVNVINISDALVSERYTSYNDVSRWVDHIAYQHNISVVAAVGYTTETDEGSLDISPLAFCKNIIIVGAVSISDNGDSYSYDEYPGSAYSTSGVYYPQIVAPGNIGTITGFPSYPLSGNSFSAPLVASAIAQIMEKDNDLKDNPVAVRSIVMACSSSIESNVGTTTDDDFAIDRKYGAGLLNAITMCMFFDTDDPEYDYNVFGNGELNEVSYNMRLYMRSCVAKISLNWDIPVSMYNGHVNGTMASGSNSFLSLKVVAPDFTVYESFDVSGTTQMLYISALDGPLGEYEITIQRHGPSSYDLTYCLAIEGTGCYLIN